MSSVETPSQPALPILPLKKSSAINTKYIFTLEESREKCRHLKSNSISFLIWKQFVRLPAVSPDEIQSRQKGNSFFFAEKSNFVRREIPQQTSTQTPHSKPTHCYILNIARMLNSVCVNIHGLPYIHTYLLWMCSKVPLFWVLCVKLPVLAKSKYFVSKRNKQGLMDGKH